MPEDQQPRHIDIDAASWTGPPLDMTPRGRFGFSYQPPADPKRRHTHLVALLLLGCFVLLWAVWVVLLGLQSPRTPSPETGQIEALRPWRRFGTIYVRPAERWLTTTLGAAGLLVPGAYVAYGALRRRIQRRQRIKQR
jgi:hypothetical protein